MDLELTGDEARLLKGQLDVRIAELERELVRTDKHELQVALDRDVERLRAIDVRLGRMITSSG
ncbi:MAG: hypothetical protein QM820_30640 [Minicystis sp.]